MPASAVTLSSTMPVVVAVAAARRQRDSSPESEVHVHLARLQRVQRPGLLAAQPQRAHPHRAHADLAGEDAEELGAALHRDLHVLDDVLLPGQVAAAVDRARTGRTCGPARPACGTRRTAGSGAATAAGRRAAARRTAASTRTSRCPTATGSRGWSGSPHGARGWTGSRSAAGVVAQPRRDCSLYAPTVRYISSSANAVPSTKSARCPR